MTHTPSLAATFLLLIAGCAHAPVADPPAPVAPSPTATRPAEPTPTPAPPPRPTISTPTTAPDARADALKREQCNRRMRAYPAWCRDLDEKIRVQRVEVAK
jgi:hypothetical protein